ncbi:hypothetical protein GGX14DRAFT_577659 [Mycena pura]|uniref:Uncharacterized protein n=1 Tax=Mycena pura TaxID=153505 RepID=A0AAD6UUL5_9AGAR|nr:hypothetical protein GGX14DRAFT_577659 [Mycena pura]
MSPLVRVHIIPDDNCKPRVRCRKRTNTLSVGLDRKHGVHTPAHAKPDFSPIVPQMSVGVRPTSTRTPVPVLVRLSCIDVFARVVRGTCTGRYADAIMLELIRKVDTAISILDEFLAIDLFCKSRQNKFRLRSEVLDPFKRQYHYIGPLDILDMCIPRGLSRPRDAL